MTERLCPITGQPLSPDRYVSPAAVNRLRAALVDLPGLMRDLTAATGGQLRFTDPNGPRPTERPLPVNLVAADAAYATRTTVLRWTTWVAQARNENTPRHWHAVAEYLDIRAHWLATQPAAGEAFDELLDAIATGRRATDRPADRHYAGTCDALIELDGQAQTCGTELYATRDTVDCPRCGTRWNVAERRTAMLDSIRDMVFPATDLARALTALTGTDVKAATVRQWAKRGHIEPDHTNAKGQPVYIAGHVIDRMTNTTSERMGA